MEAIFAKAWQIVLQAVSVCLVIGFVATIHEFGHYLIARLCGVRVDEFSLGAGPILVTKTVGDTTYNLRAIPILAFVRPAGMDPEEEFTPENDPGERSYEAKGFWAKQAILIGGSLFNFLGAIFLVTSSLVFLGRQATTIKIGGVSEESPAAKAGLRAGDVFTHFDGEEIEDQLSAIRYINNRAGKAIQVRLRRPRAEAPDPGWFQAQESFESLEIPVIPQASESDGKGRMGIAVQAFPLDEKPRVSVPPLEALKSSCSNTVSGVRQLFSMMLGLFKKIFGSLEVPKEVGGPVQIIHMISKQTHHGIEHLIYITAQISISIGVFNLMPIPGLDGGRMLLLVVATFAMYLAPLMGRKPDEVEEQVTNAFEWVNLIGILFLLGMIVTVTFKDVSRIVSGPAQPAAAESEAQPDAPKDPLPPAEGGGAPETPAKP